LCHSERSPRSEESRIRRCAKGLRKSYYVYLMSSPSRTLYAGVTNDLERRVNEHKNGAFDGFTRRYRIDRLVYFQETNDVNAAIAAEKQIKGLSRSKKFALIEQENPRWRDLSAESESDVESGEQIGILRRSGSE
jgi:putative endonuclease